MDPAQEAEAAAVMQRLASDPKLRPLAEIMAEVEQLPPGRQCAVLGHDWPDAWEVVHLPGSRQYPAVHYYRRACRRCPSIEARS